MTDNLVTIDITDHVADVRLNRPDKKNALSAELITAITDAGKTIAENKDVRAVVLSGNGGVFCAGIDINQLNDPEQAANPFANGRGGYYPNFYQACAWAWRDCPVPVICALHGVAFGGGIQVALGADIRIAHPDVKMSVMEIKWGLIPDMSASQTLRDLVRLDVAKELTFTGRIVSGDEAHQLGLVTKISETPFDDAMAMARDIASKNPDAISYGKYLLQETWHGEALDGLRVEEALQTKVLARKNQMEAVMAQLQKRAPQFEPRAVKDSNDIKSD